MKEAPAREILRKLGVSSPDEPNEAEWMRTACPFAPWLHKNKTDRSRGFSVKVEPNGISAYMCPACGMQGRLSSLARALAHYRGVDGDELLRYDEIAGKADEYDMLDNMLPTFDELEEVYEPPQPLDESLFEGLFDPITSNKAAAHFMMARRVSKATADKLGLEYDPDKKRITFPVRDREGNLFGWSGRTVLKNVKTPKVLDYQDLPKRHMILGAERWQPGKPLVLVEGLFAYARLHDIGLEEHANIGALLGSTLTDEKKELVLGLGEPVFLLMDPDEAGDKCLWGRALKEPEGDKHWNGNGAVSKLRAEVPTFVPDYPQGIDDPDDLSLDHVLDMIQNTPVWDGTDWGTPY